MMTPASGMLHGSFGQTEAGHGSANLTCREGNLYPTKVGSAELRLRELAVALALEWLAGPKLLGRKPHEWRNPAQIEPGK